MYIYTKKAYKNHIQWECDDTFINIEMQIKVISYILILHVLLFSYVKKVVLVAIYVGYCPGGLCPYTPKTTWRRTIKELKAAGLTWCTAARRGQDRGN